MIFNVILIAAFGGIAYYHYAQGFFSATISAIIAIIAAVLAVGYHENLVATVFQGNMADYSTAVSLVGIFAITYILLRTLTDMAVPGNLRLPVPIDRVGGAAMGIVAAIFTVGILALAAQSMPFGAAIGGFARYPVEDRPEVSVPPDPQHQSARNIDIHEQMSEDDFSPETRKTLWVPVDDIVLNTVAKLSDGGSMAGTRTLASIHPDYPTELFGQRIGIQTGAKKVANNYGTEQVTVPDPGLFLVTTDLTKGAIDDELPTFHERPATPKRAGNDAQLVVRVMFHKDAKDSDGYVRVSPGAVRLVANGVNYFPVGTLEGNKLLANKPDDFLLINLSSEDRGADFVFFVNPSDVFAGGGAASGGGGKNAKAEAAAAAQKIAPDVFLEVKRLARIDLSDREVRVGVVPSKSVKVDRKTGIIKKLGGGSDASAAGGGSEAAPATPAADVGFVFSGVAVAKTLFNPVNAGTPDKDIKNQQIDGGTLTLQSGQFAQLNIEPTRSLQIMGQGPQPVSELLEPPGKKLVQIKGTPPPEGGDPWAWGQLSKWQLVDAAGKTYTPAGAWAKVKKNQTDMMAASYNATGTPKDITSGDGRPTEVYIGFLVPTGTHLKEVKFNGKTLSPLDQQVQ